MAELTPYTPRSKMSMDLIKAISEPKITAQDLARQEEQERVDKFGGIRMPTQMENVFKGIEKTTGYKPYSAEQTKAERAAVIADMLANTINPGSILGGKAMMPAIAPLVTKAGRWFKTAPLPEYNEKLFNTELKKEMRFLNKRMRDVHDLGPHLGRDSGMGSSFYDWYPNYSKTENFLKGPGGSTVQAKILGKSVRVPDIGNDYEQIGRFISNDVFEDKNTFTSWMREYSPYVSAENFGNQREMNYSELFKVWKQLSKSTPKKDRGGYVGDLQGTGVSDGRLHPKNYLETEMAKIDKRMEGIDPKSSLFKSLKNQKRARRAYLKERYVDDFGSYFKKGDLMGPSWEALVRDRGLVAKFKQSMSKKGITNIKYKNTNAPETANALLGNRESGISYQRPEVKNKTATMVLDVDALESSYEKATGKEMLRSKTKDWFSKSGKREQYGLWRTLKDVIGKELLIGR